ncbi:MAG: cbb3-type cytochrome oxidase assembly protein CcoS [Magnetococcales bacterium]|nr:cbb3-type cytochrome oxidase assembly protein CcoS [Magnetococcales bacterium]
METVFILLPLAIFLGGIGLALLIWAVRNGQFDDMEGPAYRILFDDDDTMIPSNTSPSKAAPVTSGSEKAPSHEAFPHDG